MLCLLECLPTSPLEIIDPSKKATNTIQTDSIILFQDAVSSRVYVISVIAEYVYRALVE